MGADRGAVDPDERTRDCGWHRSMRIGGRLLPLSDVRNVAQNQGDVFVVHPFKEEYRLAVQGS